jgi:hypothetical protein
MTSTHYYFEPVYSTFEEVRTAVVAMEPMVLSSPGKIYFKDNYLYINEAGKGIHVIDNSDIHPRRSPEVLSTYQAIMTWPFATTSSTPIAM